MKKLLIDIERLESRQFLSVAPNDPYASKQWNIASESLDQAWQISTGSKNAVVAVIDSGIDLKNKDLINNVWTNPGEIPGDGIDNDHDGYVDDVHGWNFVNWNGNVQDGYGHGTFVSSIIGSQGNNNLGAVGINWNVSIMPLKFMTDNGVGYTAAASYAIDYAVMMKTMYKVNIVAINASFGGGTNYTSFLEASIRRANDAGIVFVAAAGNGSNNNDTRPTYPSCYDSPNVISVGALNSDNSFAGYSNYGKANVDLAAPGSNIFGCYTNSNYGYGTGSSFAAPQVAGAVALLNSVKPNISVAEVKADIFASVDKIGGLADKVFTGGKLNIAAALTMAKNTKVFVNYAPNGSLSVLSASQVKGNVSDPNDSLNPVRVRLYVDNVLRDSVLANKDFSFDLNKLNLTIYSHKIEVRVLDNQNDKETVLGSGYVNIPAPQGWVDSVSLTEIRGWAMSPRSSSPVMIQVVVNNRVVGTVLAKDSRPDLVKSFGGSGYGFRLDLKPSDFISGLNDVKLMVKDPVSGQLVTVWSGKVKK